MRKIWTILLLFCFCKGFSQDDSLLQRLIDSAKSANNVRKASTSPAVKDTQKPLPKTPALKKDSNRFSAISVDTLFSRDSSSLIFSDTTKQDSAAVAAPPVISRRPIRWLDDTAFQHLLLIAARHSKGGSTPVLDSDLHKTVQKDYLFYALIIIVLLLALTRQIFPKYFQNLFRFLFEASFRQKQRREQLMQETLPSLLMNVLFVLVGGLFVAIMADKKHWIDAGFWQITLSCVTILALVYIFKYGVIHVTGWVFNAKEPASTYSFIVFLVNKIIGLVLLPLLFLLAYSENGIWDITVTIAGFVVIFMLFFRYIISLTIIRSTLSIHPLHFFIYLCAVELMPMLIIYKLLFSVIGKGN